MLVCVMAICDHVQDRGSSGWLVGGLGQEHTFNFSSQPHTTLCLLCSTPAKRKLKVEAPKLYMNIIAMGSKPGYEGEAFIRVSLKGTSFGKEEGIRTPEL